MLSFTPYFYLQNVQMYPGFTADALAHIPLALSLIVLTLHYGHPRSREGCVKCGVPKSASRTLCDPYSNIWRRREAKLMRSGMQVAARLLGWHMATSTMMVASMLFTAQ